MKYLTNIEQMILQRYLRLLLNITTSW